jgi:ParB family chromosome partitioning protein
MEFRCIALELIRCDPGQPRQAIDKDGLEELAQSIKRLGVLQPIRVRPIEDHYHLIAGQRRWMAARMLGLAEIPAVVVQTEDNQVLLEALIENIQREDLNPIDRARALKCLRVTLGLQSWEQVGQTIGISRVHVHRLLNIGNLPPEIQDDVRVGDLTEKHARALLRLRTNPPRRAELWERIHAERLSGDDAMELARDMVPDHLGRSAITRVSMQSSDLKQLTDQFLTMLLAAAPADVESVRAELCDVRQWLTELLDGQQRRRGNNRPTS